MNAVLKKLLSQQFARARTHACATTGTHADLAASTELVHMAAILGETDERVNVTLDNF
jgi:hypothetical protein